ncbi:YceI family protein [Niabella drilacis]|uniref:Polyisoprenoid-binding protein YceI n=1 Tax=Niabella drilacis (strain DSM 25811 / CCM 8410 / CCUG 62505 / LMG 26954 / E90) TaxID=1285928 RepID=A0A1G6T7I2_NIADE|nr:YceI family protein [Niabella drilacis]SDD24989.1 Polyisoprenoid-binding protein YceI [Niabella drilacis]
MKKIFLFLGLSIFSIQLLAQTTWSADPMHSSVNFTIKHMGISFVTGKFDQFRGTLETSKADFSDAKIHFTVATASINTGVAPRDKHLKTADFFEVEKFPEMKFVSTGFQKKTGNRYALKGNLTIKDVTKPVVLEAIYGGKTKNQMGKEVIGFQTSLKINRFDYHILFDPTGQAVARDVEVRIYLELQPQQ